VIEEIKTENLGHAAIMALEFLDQADTGSRCLRHWIKDLIRLGKEAVEQRDEALAKVALLEEALDHLNQKIAHGCTDFSCPLCDGDDDEEEPLS
jgi:phosphoribosylaminoimidazole (AIR) synthetase